ncbi:hypothetical protein [Breoghania corrubedonensis]|uniref:hypothetical protein n=1 Tax=Breoghania corrubedonensis TaxID=665038 RepID=UPI0011B1F67B|nr:hypothetical protein [Breoghania corrubedonensis]
MDLSLEGRSLLFSQHNGTSHGCHLFVRVLHKIKAISFLNNYQAANGRGCGVWKRLENPERNILGGACVLAGHAV